MSEAIEQNESDTEIIAITECVRVLNPLGYAQLRRVFDYLGRRYLDSLLEQRRQLQLEIVRVERLVAEQADVSPE